MRDAFFFGPDSSLFGIYEEPASSVKRTGIVLCYPIGQEYIRSHRIFVMLAHDLAARGYPVLRFDFSGTGDSAGGNEQHSLQRWQGDLVVALETLRSATAIQNVAVIGARLGGTVAAMKCESNLVDTLLLWDPVLDGRLYLRELEMAERSYSEEIGIRSSVHDNILLGFQLSSLLQREITALSPHDVTGQLLSVRHLAITTQTAPINWGRSFDEVHTPPAQWLKTPGDEHVYVPRAAVDALVNWITGVCE